MRKQKPLIRRCVLLLLFIVAGGLFLVAGCSKPPGPGNCEKNHTAILTFKNTSSNSKLRVVLDGSTIGSIWPDDSITREVAAGYHTVAFKYANSGKLACSVATPNVAQCSCRTISCSAGG